MKDAHRLLGIEVERFLILVIDVIRTCPGYFTHLLNFIGNTFG
jgi:hypothetical protein